MVAENFGFLNKVEKNELGLAYLPEGFSFVETKAINRDGNEKIVYQVTDEVGQKYAVKILAHTSGSLVSDDERIRSEFDVTRIMKNTSLSSFIPQPMQILKRNGFAFGMIMEWRDGHMINKLGRCLPLDSVVVLEEGLMRCSNQIRPSFDSIGPLNICFGKSGMWLSELELDTSGKDAAEYKKEVSRLMDQLKRYYVVDGLTL